MYGSGFEKIMDGSLGISPFRGLDSIGHWGFAGLLIFFAVLAWSLVWKGFALWRAARNKSVPWFVALLLINTLGILEILYIFVFGRKSNSGTQE